MAAYKWIGVLCTIFAPSQHGVIPLYASVCQYLFAWLPCLNSDQWEPVDRRFHQKLYWYTNIPPPNWIQSDGDFVVKSVCFFLIASLKRPPCLSNSRPRAQFISSAHQCPHCFVCWCLNPVASRQCNQWVPSKRYLVHNTHHCLNHFKQRFKWTSSIPSRHLCLHTTNNVLYNNILFGMLANAFINYLLVWHFLTKPYWLFHIVDDSCIH